MFRYGHWQWWLNIDSDNPPLKNPLDLISLDKDVIGCPTPIWHWERKGEFPVYLNVYQWDSAEASYRAWPPGDGGLQRVDGIGTGCFLMARRVLDKMHGPIFQRTYDEHGRMLFGNDLAFSNRARGCGVELWAHFDYVCGHHHELDLDHVACAIMRMKNG